MATRRPPSSRSGSAMPPPTSTRSRSVMSNTRSSSSPAIVGDASDAPPALRKLGPGSKDGAELNIKVVVRCRGRSAREVESASPDIFTAIGAKGSELTIETAPQSSKLGVVTPAVTRTYPFDLTFGPEADQCLVYDEVVAPMLQEVLQGYNCTLFAYGQTGSGKTHTMQGDVVPTAMGNPSVNAGMIPRVLFKLFEHLETLPDYAVKVSYIELYNEDLRDLLAPEATKDTPRTELKIFDDSAKKGVFIQGLEEVGVRSIGDALGALSRGSQRRQIAATKMNDHSSRSHSVFTLTVHTKEASPAGEDLLRVGKMNLVDLAGSENIGRSGAADKRAREAGMINQSLLTLGRVINGLVDGAAHVPYRESKLTRLLQDSLGGRTKTSIIATVSPARVNMEETLSTLEYALRAKSIRNKPEVNTRMTRNALLKEYVAEMERLKADVLAAREKNGIFVSELRWGELEAEQDAARRGALDAKKQIEAAESQLRNLQEEFKQSITLLGRKDTELTDARGQLEATAHTLEQTASQLRTTETALEEEAAVRRAHEQAEELLDQIATGLRETLVQSLGDNAGLFDKLDRKAGVLTANTDTVRTHGQALSRDVQALSTQLESFASSATQHAQKVKLEVEHLRRTELDVLAALTDQVNEQAHRTQEALGVVQAKEAIGDEAMRSIETVVTTALDHLKKGFAAWGEKMRQTSQAKCNSLQESSQSSFTSIEQAMKNVSASTESIIRETNTYVQAERQLASDARSAVEDAVAAEVVHLQAQNAHLTRLLEAERLEGARDREALMQTIGAAIGEYAATRERRMRGALGEVERANGAAEAALGKLGAGHGQMMDDALERGKQLGFVLDKKGSELKRTRDGATKALTSYGGVVNDGVANMQSHLLTSISTYDEEVQAHANVQRASYDSARERLSRAKRARHDAVQQVEAGNQTFAKAAQENIASSSKLVSSSTTKIASGSTDWHTATSTYTTGAASQLRSARQATQALLSDGTREDVPTGATPQKRRWVYTDKWDRTQTRGAGPSSLRTELATVAASATREDEVAEEDDPMDDGEDADAPVTPAEPESGSPASDAAPPPPYEDVAPKSKPAHSRTSSTASNTMPAPTRPTLAPAKRALSGLPKSASGTLTERPANVLTNRRRLR